MCAKELTNRVRVGLDHPPPYRLPRATLVGFRVWRSPRRGRRRGGNPEQYRRQHLGLRIWSFDQAYIRARGAKAPEEMGVTGRRGKGACSVLCAAAAVADDDGVVAWQR